MRFFKISAWVTEQYSPRRRCGGIGARAPSEVALPARTFVMVAAVLTGRPSWQLETLLWAGAWLPPIKELGLVGTGARVHVQTQLPNQRQRHA